MKEINTSEVFKNIKKHRGERFAKILREAELLDVPNIEHILEFAQLEDLKRLIPTIRSKCKIMSVSQYNTDKNPLELLDEAGYDAFVAETEKQKNSIKKYYRHGEELCTFRDPDRHKNFYIIHAVKRGADKIKPSATPKREDEYGTSVISIQIAKAGGFISIKNRYNHMVNNPDATFGNNPDNIIPGLTNSLRKFFRAEFNVSDVDMPEDYIWINDQLVWYDFEKDNVYFGDDYYFTGGIITRLNKDREIMFEGLIYNDKEKTITSPTGNNETTLSVFADAFNGKKVARTYNEKTKETTLATPDGNRIIISKGRITELCLPNVKQIGDEFLRTPTSLKSIDLPNVKEIGNRCLETAPKLTSINLPKVEKIHEKFLYYSEDLTSINLPNVKEIGASFLSDNKVLESINLPDVRKIYSDFLSGNENLTSIDLPKVESIGQCFLKNNNKLTSVNFPNVKEIGASFLSNNKVLKSIDLPNIKEIKSHFLGQNKNLTSINLPNVEEIYDCFLISNNKLTSIDLPNVKRIGDMFLTYNSVLKSINLPNVEEIGDDFLWVDPPIFLPGNEKVGNYNLTSINLPKKYNWLVEKLLSRNKSKTRKLKNAVKKVLKKITQKTLEKNVSDNSR